MKTRIKALATINPRKLAKIARKGPAAWEIAQNHQQIRFVIEGLKRPFLSLRATAKLLGASHHTLLDWEKARLLIRVHSRTAGIHPKYRVSDLMKFVNLLQVTVTSYPSPAERFGLPRPRPFGILRQPFAWATSEKSLTPREIAHRVGCHPSTIVRAIKSGQVHGRKRTSHRWEIRRLDWQRSFFALLEN